jgi:hypothetical protein
MAIDDDKDTNVESGAAMGFGGGGASGGVAPDVNVGAAYDADRGGLGSGLGLTEDRGRELGDQVSQGTANAWGPSFGTKSNIGAAVGTVVGALAGIPGLGLLGAYAPGAVNDIMGHGRGAMAAAGTPFEGSSIAPGSSNSGSGGLLGVGNDQGQADALAALYTLLMAKQRAAA